jgi:hypothetical protein
MITDADRKAADAIFIASIRRMGKEPSDDWLLEILAAHREAALEQAAKVAEDEAERHAQDQAKGGAPALVWDQALRIAAAIRALKEQQR